MQKIRILREAKGWTQEVLAKKLCVTVSTVSNYENGKREPNIEMLMRLSKVFKCTVDDLIKKSA